MTLNEALDDLHPTRTVQTKPLGSNVVMHASVTANTTGAVACGKRAGTINPDFVQKHKVMTNVISDRPDESIVANVQHLQPR
jgi:hypothetical protein